MTPIKIFKDLTILPTDALDPLSVIYKEEIGCSIAGCVGKEISSKKPGINEDGGSILISDNGYVFSILIDGHFDRDTTEIMLKVFKDELMKISKYSTFENFMYFTKQYSQSVINEIKISNALGEASFMMVCLNLISRELYYYSVGDVMLFIHDPRRMWGEYYQISNRHYYEWINQSGLLGEHYGNIRIDNSFEIIITTDGLIDQPVISNEEIENVYRSCGVKKIAQNLVQHGLDTNIDDDNITVIHFNIELMIQDAKSRLFQ